MPSRCGTKPELSRHFPNWKPMLTARAFQPCPFCLEGVFTRLRKFVSLLNERTWNLPCLEVNARALSCAWPVDLRSMSSRRMSARVCVQDMSSLTYTGAGIGGSVGSCVPGVESSCLGPEPDLFWHPDAAVPCSQVRAPACTFSAGVRTRMKAGGVWVTVSGIRCVSRTLARTSSGAASGQCVVTVRSGCTRFPVPRFRGDSHRCDRRQHTGTQAGRGVVWFSSRKSGWISRWSEYRHFRRVRRPRGPRIDDRAGYAAWSRRRR